MRRIQILLVEDDLDTRELLAEMLEENFVVHTAASAEEGLVTMEVHRCDVVITDEALPGLAGTQLAAELKARYPEVRVILVSGFTRVANAQACDRVLSKPLDFDRLNEALEAP